MITIINTPSKAKALAAVPDGYASTGYFRNRVPYDGLYTEVGKYGTSGASLQTGWTNDAVAGVLTASASAAFNGATISLTDAISDGQLCRVRFNIAVTAGQCAVYLGNNGSVPALIATYNTGTHVVDVEHQHPAGQSLSLVFRSNNGSTALSATVSEVAVHPAANVIIADRAAQTDLTTNVASPQSSSSGWATDWASAADNAALQTLIDGKHLVTFRGKAVMDDGGLFDDFFDDFFG